jgi:hypothetical protein
MLPVPGPSSGPPVTAARPNAVRAGGPSLSWSDLRSPGYFVGSSPSSPREISADSLQPLFFKNKNKNPSDKVHKMNMDAFKGCQVGKHPEKSVSTPQTRVKCGVNAGKRGQLANIRGSCRDPVSPHVALVLLGIKRHSGSSYASLN